MSDFYCPACMLHGAVHNECDTTSVVALKFSRFANERYTCVQLVCQRCAYIFWSSHPNAVALAAAKGFSFAVEA